MNLQTYREKRQFNQTPEPSGDGEAPRPGSRFVVQKHAASRLHYDLRLEMDGVLKSWAVPKGPSLDPSVRTLAVAVEDHPLGYATFEGVIPRGQYGGGTVMLWDQGSWIPEDDDPLKAYQRGKLKFRLEGKKLTGRWHLVRMSGEAGEGGKNWLWIKSRDEASRPADEFSIVERAAKSVKSGRTLDQIADDADAVWSSGKEKRRPNRGERSVGGEADSPGGDEPASRPLIDPAALPGSRRATLPRSFKPQLATLGRQTPSGEQWLHELKYDGYRLLCRVEDGAPQLLTRRGNDWTARFPTVARAVADLRLHDTIIDGEVVVLEADGTTNFQALQNLMRRGRDDRVVYYAFDLPFLAGHDLTATPLIERKQLLAKLLRGASDDSVLRYSDHIAGDGQQVLEHACRHHLEGLVSKRADSRYEQRRARSWVKSKCLKRDEFVVGGWTEPSGARQGFGALLLGYFHHGHLRYCGRVGTGFTSQSLLDVRRQLDEVPSPTSPFEDPPTGAEARDVHWVLPKLVAEVEFGSWTDDGRLRQASFQGLREDKEAVDVVPTEQSPSGRSPQADDAQRADDQAPSAAPRTKPSRRPIKVAGVRLTSPDRVLYPQEEITKRELAEYYESVSEWILPHLEGRPLTLVRCPKGRQGACFFQRNWTASMPAALRGIEIDDEEDGPKPCVAVENVEGLLSLAQMSVLEVHPWAARKDRLDRPDRLVMDLDPGEGTDFQAVVDAALEVRDRLESHGLQSFVRTTGGKGLHVVAPLIRRTSWERLKQFAKSLADGLAAEAPDRYIATASKPRRRGKVFVDYLRNQRAATAVASYSTRARPGAPVATPLRWDELDGRLEPDKYTIRNLLNRLTSLDADPWEDFFAVRQSLKARG